MRNALVIPERWTEITVQNSFPIAEILLVERGVEAIEMSRGSDISGQRAFAEHLLNGISGDEVDQQKNQAYYQPDDWQGVEDALEERFQQPVLSGQLPVSKRL